MKVDHEFIPYAANPGICSICGGVQPYGCYNVNKERDTPDDEEQGPIETN